MPMRDEGGLGCGCGGLQVGLNEGTWLEVEVLEGLGIVVNELC